MSLYQYFEPNPDPLDAIKWIAGRKTTNLYRAQARCMAFGLRLKDLNSGEFVIREPYEAPNLVPHQDRTVQERKASWRKFVEAQLFVNA